MSVTLLRARDDNDFYYLDNNTFEYKWGYTDSDYDYQYDCYSRNTNFKIGNSMFHIRPIIFNSLVTHLDIKTPSIASQITIEIEFNKGISDRNLPELYFKPIGGILKLPKQGYHTIAVSKYPFSKASLAFINGSAVFSKPFSILVFNKNLEFIGSTVYSDLTSELQLGFSLDAKFSTLSKFESIEKVAELLLQR